MSARLKKIDYKNFPRVYINKMNNIINVSKITNRKFKYYYLILHYILLYKMRYV